MSRRIWISDISLYSYGSMDSDVIDFCGGLVQRVNHILDMPAVKLEKTVLDRLRGNVAAADPYGGGGAAYHIQHQLQQIVYVIAGMLPSQTLVVNVLFQFFSAFVSLHLQSQRGGLSGEDGWISLNKLRLVSLSMIRVDFFDFWKSSFPTS